MSKQACKRLRRKLKLEVNREALPSYAWPGGYPLYYLCADSGTLCPSCVNAEIDLIDVAKRDHDKQWDVIACDVHYEGDPLTCDHCNCEIESAYGNPDDE